MTQARVQLALQSDREIKATVGNAKFVRTPTNRRLQRKNRSVTLPVQVPYQVVHATRGRIRLRVPKLYQDAEYARTLQTLLAAERHVKTIKLKQAAASIAITYDAKSISDEEVCWHLINLIQAANQKIVPLASTPAPPSPQDTTNPWSSLKLPALATTLALLGGPVGIGIPPIFVAGAIAAATLPVARRALEGISTERRLNIDFLDFLAISITTLQGHFLTPALMLSLIEAGETIREQTARSSQSQTLNLLDALGQWVWVERQGQKQQVPIDEVQPGDTVIVYPGNQIPVDGRILRGKALIDEQKLTGESLPILREQGQAVYASTLVREGRLYLLAERVGADTRAGQSIKLMQEAPVHDTRVENHAAKLANRAVVPTILLASAVLGVTRNLARAASVLTIDFATGIRVSVPTTVLAALTYAARRGILIRSGRALEQLAQIDTIVFDKTGTLTKGEIAIVGVESLHPPISHQRVLELAAAAEQRLMHPVAEAVVRYARSHDIGILPRSHWDYEVGLGVRAQIDGESVLVGSQRFLEQQGIEWKPQVVNPLYNGTSTIYVASNGELLGTLHYQDCLRPESEEVVRTLHAQGMEVHLLTGDNRRTANAVATQLGILPHQTHAEAFPEQKAQTVRKLHEQGKTVAFVGDGLNDSPALAYADVSVSFAEGSEIARETADVVLMQNDLFSLLEAIATAKQAKQLIQQNTGLVAIPNLGALLMAATVGMNPLAATVVNNGSAVAAGVNGLRPIFRSRKDGTLRGERRVPSLD